MTRGIKVENLCVRQGENFALDNVSFQANRNTFVGIIGPNGSGKSTLLSALSGLLPVRSGAIEIGGKALSGLGNIERAKCLSYLPQARPVHWSITVEELVLLGRYAWGDVGRGFGMKGSVDQGLDKKAVDNALASTNANHLRERHMHTLSGGEQARIHLARALAGNTPILLADEPTNALDPGHQFSLMAMLQARANENRLVMAAIHDFSLAARYCDVLLVLDEGCLMAQGTPREVLTGGVLNDIFKVDGYFQSDERGENFIVTPQRH